MIRLRLSLCLVLALLILATAASTLAYKVDDRWGHAVSAIPYSIDPNNDTNLRVSGSSYAIRSADVAWDEASMFRLNWNPAWNPNGNIFSTANFLTVYPCGQVPDEWPAVTCQHKIGAYLVKVRSYFNVSPSYVWNTSGVENCSLRPKRVDVKSSAVHEMGHWFEVDDFPAGHPESVMWGQCNGKQSLAEDDRQGATQIYGPWTSFENTQAKGIANTIAYSRYVVGYYGHNNPPPELGRRQYEMGVPLQ